MMSAEFAIARGTGSPVVVTDERRRIVAMNDAAERLLGRSAAELKGQPCFAALKGKDRFGNCFCHEHCTVGTMATTGEAVSPFELTVAAADGAGVRVACSVVVLRSERPGQHRIVHILTPIPASAGEHTSVPRNGAAHGQSGEATAAIVARSHGLTLREAEILRLLARGQSCHQIANTLFISLPTVRNHVHNFLRKLDVHSQVEAVARAFREGLV